ncbi:GxxExxY protein [Spirosoma sp. HMF3257]|uniref:GxxExxY protein n=1 Tax=Spirosoma telluris TaxID=2183553 RepID=A0A327NT32_9BACT|nr:GxxExxY protein [Spirosoma telluris]RAI77875.1 GxxExxY protein [Spirosoma telluris]
MNTSYQHSDLTHLILKAFFNVYNTLGYGFLEKVYENAMHLEINKLGLSCIAQQPIDVYYDKEKVGLYYADLVVNDCIIVELKAATGLAPEHEAQLTNYLKATDIEVGLLLNFGREPQYKRKAFANNRKNHL